LAPIGLLYLASLLQPVYLDRALLPSAAILCLALGWLVTTGKAPMPMRAIAAAALGITTIQGLAGFYNYRGFPHAPFEELVTRLRSDWEPGEVIVHSNKISALPSAYYGPDLDLHYLADSPESPNDTLARPTQEVLGLLADADIVAAVGDSDGVWFIQFRQEVEDYVALGIQIPPALAWLEQNFGLAAQFAVGDLQVFHFEARAPRG
jgi:hypothetical protein